MSLSQLSGGLHHRRLRLRRSGRRGGFYEARQQEHQRGNAAGAVDTRAADKHSARQQTEDHGPHEIASVSHRRNIGTVRVVAMPISKITVQASVPAAPTRFATVRTGAGARARSRFLRRLIWLVAALGFIAAGNLFAAESPAGPERFVKRAQRLYLEARERHAQQPGDPAAGVRLGKACFDRAEFATNDTERAALAVEGINVCRQVIERDAASAAAHLFLGLNLGQLARTKTLGALRLVGEMESEFKRAIALDPAVEYGGPDRYLGQLYQQAPGWPTSIGSRSRARQHLARACELSPDFPDNRLALLEALMDWNDRRNFPKEARLYLELLPASRGKYSGENWAAAWAEWDQRWQKLAAYLAKLEGGKN